MDRIELYPTLSPCIESTAREEFWSIVNQYVEARQEDKDLEEKIELLNWFVESVDFGKLRSQSEGRLVEGRRVKS